MHHEIHYTIQEGLDAIRDVIYYIETYDVTTAVSYTHLVDEFIQVVPIEYKRVLQEEQMRKLQQKIADVQRDY